MSVNITIPKEYGYVVVTAAATFFVGLWHGTRVPGFRKPTGLKAPNAYADTGAQSAATAEQKQAMFLYNCAQRAHGNYMEYHTSTVLALLIAGVQYPVSSAVLGAIWTVGRIVYAVGYTSLRLENGRARGPGYMVSTLAALGLWGMTAYSGLKLLK